MLAAGLLAGLGGAAAADGELNISQFVFRDLNRNGIYDLGESPYAGVPVRLRQFGHGLVVEESNLSGFANFVMSAGGSDDAQITGPGRLIVEVEPPEGLEITTGNPLQRSEAILVPGSPAGLAIDPTLPFVGVAPVLTIEAGEALRCGGDSDAPRSEARGGAEVCAAAAGAATVILGEAPRTVALDGWPVRIAAGIGEPSEGPASRIGFEEIISSMNIQEVPTGYGGLIWHNWVVVHRKYYGGWGYVNGTAEGQFAAYNSSGHPARMASDGPFDLVGMLVSVAWPRAMKAPVTIEALRDGEVVASDSFVASNMRPLWFAPGWNGIDELRLAHDTYWQVVIDEVAVRHHSAP